MPDATDLHAALLASHVVAGFATLVTFWLPIATSKGGLVHRRSGRAFVWLGSWVAVSAVVGSLWALVFPVHYLRTRGVPAAAAAGRGEELEFFFATLLFLGVALLADLWLGVRLVETQARPMELATPAIRVGQWLTLATAAWLLAFGTWRLYATGGAPGYALCVVVGLVGVVSTPGTLRDLADPSPAPHRWLYKHIEVMIGCGSGFHIAFLLFGLPRIASPAWSGGQLVFVAIVAPLALGAAATRHWTRRYRRRFGEL